MRCLHATAAPLAAALFGLALAVPCAAQETPAPAAGPTAAELQRVVAELRRQNESLQAGLVEARRQQREANEALSGIRSRLEALGRNLLDGGDERLVQAAADIQVLNERLRDVESRALGLSATVADYLRQAVVADPDARLRVETALRELDAALGLRHKPRPDVRVGNLQQATVVSIDSESGLLVLNVGEKAGTRIGMSFRLLHGDRPYAKAVVADVRPDVCGAFVEQLEVKDQQVRLGDLAILETQS
jgi:hypothetical protein